MVAGLELEEFDFPFVAVFSTVLFMATAVCVCIECEQKFSMYISSAKDSMEALKGYKRYNTFENRDSHDSELNI